MCIAHLKSQQRNHNGHPAQCHGDMSPPLLCDHIHRAQEQDGPHDIIEDHQAQEGHEDPQGDTHHLQWRAERKCLRAAGPAAAAWASPGTAWERKCAAGSAWGLLLGHTWSLAPSPFQPGWCLSQALGFPGVLFSAVTPSQSLLVTRAASTYDATLMPWHGHMPSVWLCSQRDFSSLPRPQGNPLEPTVAASLFPFLPTAQPPALSPRSLSVKNDPDNHGSVLSLSFRP